VLALASGCGGSSSGGGEINRESIASCLREAEAEVREANARGIRPHEDGFFHLYYDHPTWELEGLVASIEDNDVAVVAVTGEDSVTGGWDEAGMASRGPRWASNSRRRPPSTCLSATATSSLSGARRPPTRRRKRWRAASRRRAALAADGPLGESRTISAQ
jgi:hypothetical protein